MRYQSRKINSFKLEKKFFWKEKVYIEDQTSYNKFNETGCVILRNRKGDLEWRKYLALNFGKNSVKL